MVIASWPLLCFNKVIIVTTDSVILSILWKHEVQVRKIISILRLTRKNTMLIKKCSKILINDARLKHSAIHEIVFYHVSITVDAFPLAIVVTVFLDSFFLQ